MRCDPAGHWMPTIGVMLSTISASVLYECCQRGFFGLMFAIFLMENVSGPVTIARYANATADMGPAWFLNFLALVGYAALYVYVAPWHLPGDAWYTW